MKLLIVLTSHDTLGENGVKTGFWIEEFAAPYYVFLDAGATITIASPNGGQPPVDPKSELEAAQTKDTKRFYKDYTAIDLVAHTFKLKEINQADYDGVFYPGGHGPLWDLATDEDSINLIEDFNNYEKPMAFVCHAAAALINAKTPDGTPVVKGKNLTSFSNAEEEALKLTKVVPFLLEDELVKNGAIYSKGSDGASYVKQDGVLITGQNAASSAAVANLLVEAINSKK
ncbi:type 1 glutamine amidotransferase domain-containing protein [Flavobacterium sp.]|uniref:type 1 glutamine amidotransferase domain-containing protein n=1 Tax=Flavobacterium sp. TaxID=239 RepID=UPI002613CAAD|nr:type 1 glutamine amidotransferase domain-containing protein [Flavobacterium sp.]